MSRSYKKNPIVTELCDSRKKLKRLANQKFRRQIAKEEDMPARPQHKKYSESWDIVDYKLRMTKSEAIDWYQYRISHDCSDYFRNRFPTLESWLKYWEKIYRRK